MAKKILIVDDEEDIVQLIENRLKIQKYKVVTAADGLAGLETARRERPDLIILDVMMPKMDGYRVCRMLKFDREYQAIPIVMLTAKGEPADEETGKSVKADAYLSKPFDAEKLMKTVKELLKEA